MCFSFLQFYSNSVVYFFGKVKYILYFLSKIDFVKSKVMFYTYEKVEIYFRKDNKHIMIIFLIIVIIGLIIAL